MVQSCRLPATAYAFCCRAKWPNNGRLPSEKVVLTVRQVAVASMQLKEFLLKAAGFKSTGIGTEINLEMAYNCCVEEALRLTKVLGRRSHHTSLLTIKFDVPSVGDQQPKVLGSSLLVVALCSITRFPGCFVCELEEPHINYEGPGPRSAGAM
jgi:hypothetical protein